MPWCFSPVSSLLRLIAVSARLLPWRHGLLLALGAAGPALAVAAPATETLVWAGAPYAPMVIREGPLRDRGYVDRMIAEVLQPLLPQYRHETLDMSPLRLERELLGAELAVCSAAFSRSPARVGLYAFSVALFRFLPTGVVLRRKDARAAVPAAGVSGERPALSLRELLARQVRLGLVGHRAHGAAVDSLLAAHPGQVQRFILGGSNQSVLAMLARAHAIDAALVYEFELRYFSDLNPELGQTLIWWPLAELSETQLSYIACAANPAGQRAAAAIDAVLLRPGVRERLQALYEEWLDADSQQQLRALRGRLGARYWQE